MTALREPRNPIFEQELTRHLATGLSVDVESINRFAGDRANNGAGEYGTGFPERSRDLPREALEEIADLRNYLVWALERVHRGHAPDGLHVGHLQCALRHTILAFDEVSRARKILREVD